MKLIVFFLTFSFAFSLTMEEAIRSAIEKNPEIRSQRHAVSSAFYSYRADTNLYLPNFFASASFSRLSQKQSLHIPPFGPFPPLSVESAKQNYRAFSIGLREVLYDGGAREGRVNISSSEVRLQQDLYGEKLEDIKLQVIKAYLDVLSSQEIVDVYRKQLEAIDSQYRRAEAFYKEGLVAITDVLQAKVRLAEVQRDLRKAEGDYSVALANLSKLTGIPQEKLKDLQLPQIADYQVPDLESLYLKALERRLILRAYSERVYQAKKLQDIERSKYLPKVFAQAEYTYSDQNPVISPKGVYTLSLGLSLEFQTLEPYYRVLSRLEEEKRARWELENLKEAIKLEIKKAYEDVLTAKDNLRVAEDALRYAEEFYKLSQEQYKNQIISSTDLLLAEASLTQARKNKVLSYYEYLKAYYELMRAVGGEI
ncbi:MAG: TolC family protein [Hydrogenobacter thermophilus]|nr:TolC family protein [Hydrogenobacter thermophilus]